MGGQYTKICFRGGDCIHQTEVLTENRKGRGRGRHNPRMDDKVFCVTSFQQGRRGCHTESTGEILFLYSSGGKWKKLELLVAISMIN